MSTITLEYDGRNSSIKNIISGLVGSGLMQIKKEEKTTDTPKYNAQYVAKVRKIEKEPAKKLDLKKYGFNI